MKNFFGFVFLTRTYLESCTDDVVSDGIDGALTYGRSIRYSDEWMRRADRWALELKADRAEMLEKYGKALANSLEIACKVAVQISKENKDLRAALNVADAPKRAALN